MSQVEHEHYQIHQRTKSADVRVRARGRELLRGGRSGRSASGGEAPHDSPVRGGSDVAHGAASGPRKNAAGASPNEAITRSRILIQRLYALGDLLEAATVARV